ncbi:MAG: hypothetical protein CVV21_05635 [Candidatus Goldiibacteriota bacterium HGW-Goldbacteria-1]|jgi:hypothetical protein|nr:MAG: hypothetical protein CVV21_05635 [Candidatus Goldiibacteriota bacterium HGW-Goldbacteria-1]
MGYGINVYGLDVFALVDAGLQPAVVIFDLYLFSIGSRVPLGRALLTFILPALIFLTAAP